MTQTKRLNDSAAARWLALIIVSFTMMCGYFITDVMAPLEDLLTKSPAEGGLGWTSDDYGFFSGAYGYINVFLLMLFFGGIILDKCGVRFTGIMSSGLMLVGTLIKWYAVNNNFGTAELFGYPTQVLLAALGFAIFGMGAQNENQWAVFDTNVDMMCALVGAIPVAIILLIVLSVKEKKSLAEKSAEKEEKETVKT